MTNEEKSLSDERVKIHTGAGIQGCHTWGWYYPAPNVKEKTGDFLKELKANQDFDDEDKAFIDELVLKHFGKKLI